MDRGVGIAGGWGYSGSGAVPNAALFALAYRVRIKSWQYIVELMTLTLAGVDFRGMTMKPGSSLADRADGLQSDIGPAHSALDLS